MAIAVVGSINMDIVNTVKKHPLPGETIHGSKTVFFSGGKGANQAVSASRSGGDILFLGAVGKDSFANDLKLSLIHEGIKTLLCEKDDTSGLAMITVDKDGQNSIILSSGANGKLTPEDVEIVFDTNPTVTSVLLQNEIPWETTEYVIKEGHKRGIQIVLNPAPALQLPKHILRYIDVLIVNEFEAKVITNQHVSDQISAENAAKQMIENGASEVIITLGKNGSLYYNSEHESIFTPSFNVKVVDTTSAGDTFIGVFAVMKEQRATIHECLRFATAAAAITVSREGAQISIPTKQELERFLDQGSH